MSLDYTWEKLHVAVIDLAAGTGSIQDRLYYAYSGALILLYEQDDFPEEMREQFEAIQTELTSVKPSGNEGSIKASTDAMTDSKATEIAKKIVSLYDSITRIVAIKNEALGQ